MYADIQKYAVKLAIIRAYRSLIVRGIAGYKMVCTTDLYTAVNSDLTPKPSLYGDRTSV